MKDIKAYYRTAIKVADTMLKDPKNSVNEVLKTQLGYKSGIKGFFSDPWNWLFFAHPLTLGGRILYVYMKHKERQRVEMEMMKRNIIAKMLEFSKHFVYFPGPECDPIDQANACLFLASDMGRHVKGQVIQVCNGAFL